MDEKMKIWSVYAGHYHIVDTHLKALVAAETAQDAIAMCQPIIGEAFRGWAPEVTTSAIEVDLSEPVIISSSF